MKKKIHPTYQEVLFIDSSTNHMFVCGSTLQPKETEEYKGKEYPVCRVPISSSSHPFFTGSNQFIDTEGRVNKFTKKYQNKKQVTLDNIKKEEEAAKSKVKPKKKAIPKSVKTVEVKTVAEKPIDITKKTKPAVTKEEKETNSEVKKEAKPENIEKETK